MVRDGIMGFLLWLIALISLVIGPVALLVFFQLQFLPYHEPWITWWQRIAVVVDFALLWTLWPAVGLREVVSMEKGKGRRRGLVEVTQRIGTIVGMLLITVGSVALVFAVATFPGEWLEERLKPLQPIALLRRALIEGEVDTDARKPQSLWSNRLVLPGLDVIDHTKLDTEEKIAALPVTASLRARHLEGAVLIDAGLRKVDFTAARLKDANLDGADLRAAKLDQAELQSASLYDAQLQGASLKQTQLQGATLNHAQLQGASLAWAQLQGASLDSAQLHGASLSSAQLQGALLSAAQLQGALLAWAQLQGASLDYALLQGASLYDAQLQGASLDYAQLQGASLDYAQLQGASLKQTQLQGASLTKAFVWRADARTANATDARVDRAETGPKQLGGPWTGIEGSTHSGRLADIIQGKVLDWSTESLNSLKQRIRQEVPEGPLQLRALAQVEPRLDPETPLHEEVQMAERWVELQRSPAPDAYEAKLARQWSQIGCWPNGAPYVIAGLISTMDSPISPFSPDSVQVYELAADFLKDGCAGARGLSDDAKGKLKALRNRAGRLANPSVQAPRP
jgi:uncharacterized protein YjbI with pentapeptide repeats